MTYFDDNEKALHIDCPKCGMAFVRDAVFVAKHMRFKTWACPHCKKRFEVTFNVAPPNPEKPTEPPAAVTENVKWVRGKAAPLLKRVPAPRQRGFYSKIAGVSHLNDNGTSRQAIIKRCHDGERLTLVCEPLNPVDPNAVMILRSTGEQLGYLEARVAAELCDEISKGQNLPCYITNITGFDRPTWGVNIYIGDKPPHEEKVSEYPSIYPNASTGEGSVLIALLTLIGMAIAAAYFVSQMR